MTSELYRDITENTLPTAAALLVLTIAIALSLACGGGGGASPECLDTLYSGRMHENAREQLSQPVASMDNAARLATIKALAPSEGYYKINAESAECGEFVRELEEWENTNEGKQWHEENGEDIASVINTTWGIQQCEDALDHDSVLESVEYFFGDLDLTDYRIHSGRDSFRKSDDYIYQVSRTLRMEEIYVPKNSFGKIEQYLECAVKADVDTRRRTVTNIEVVQGELVQDGIPLRSYSKTTAVSATALNEPAAPEQTEQPATTQPADIETTATSQPQTLTPVPTPTIHLYARLEPDPSTVTFTAEHGLFKTFTVRTSYPNGVRLVLDPDRTLYGIPKLDFGVGESPPTHSGCPSNTRHTRQLNEGSKIHLEACTYGTTTIQLIPWHREVTKLDAIETYTISIPEPEPTRTPTPEPPDA